MRGIEVVRQVVETKQCVLFRRREDGEYSIKDIGEIGRNKAQKEGWVLLDLFSCSVILEVWEALTPGNREKLERMPLQRMADVAFSVVK